MVIGLYYHGINKHLHTPLFPTLASQLLACPTLTTTTKGYSYKIIGPTEHFNTTSILRFSMR
jgi:hypothetical protein